MAQEFDLNSLNVTIVHRRIKHHAKHSGYNTVFEYMKIPHAEGGLRSYIASHIPASLRWRLHTLRPQAVGDEGLLPELKAMSTVASSSPGICHFIYGEDTYFYTPLWQHKNKKVIASYHYPPVRLDERVNNAVLSRLDAVVLMSNSQKDWFAKYMPEEKIYVVNHHVDTNFFVPAPPTTDTKLKIVSLGGILRDMNLLHEVVSGITKMLGKDQVEFNFLIPKSEWPKFKHFDNVNLLSGISDEQLRDLYQTSTIGFMPLIDCTANNAVLEMMACGTAIVCSNVGGISDYITSDGAIMFSHDTDPALLCEQIIQLSKQTEKIKIMGKFNRKRAEKEFSLAATANKLKLVYQSICQQS
ncbi:glycosyltransferase family 4 protein [Aliiglaciecola sp. 2_MG-2023]|uniref:glycosyltransferase family 4 protein n=1 Tax=unclassified Aliiglaciecola TaxID=2593648 RepID=UPI0026E41055|nr:MULTISPECIES: glycosyltransferase family 4 protein [unclassified Aliiglaciecola]MDO6709194.1 glycosyltransferase family 4 protein [Aliiglaciecola sp. 2_MG-2023]MDO6750342.1 glycosyltransferase family 4 protein [Aliiglaciecola sp. 1_MG-2023]